MNSAPGSVAALLVAKCPPEELRRMRYAAVRRAGLHIAEARASLGDVITIDAAIRVVTEQGSFHGKAGTYNRGCRCDPCRRAKAQYQRERRRLARIT